MFGRTETRRRLDKAMGLEPSGNGLSPILETRPAPGQRRQAPEDAT